MFHMYNTKHFALCKKVWKCGLLYTVPVIPPASSAFIKQVLLASHPEMWLNSLKRCFFLSSIYQITPTHDTKMLYTNTKYVRSGAKSMHNWSQNKIFGTLAFALLACTNSVRARFWPNSKSDALATTGRFFMIKWSLVIFTGYQG